MLRRTIAIAWLVLCVDAAAECPGDGRLTEALRLVDQANPVLLAADAAHAEADRAHPWKATLNLGYDTSASYQSGPAGAKATLQVQIPLFDRTPAIARAKERAALVAQHDATAAAFLADIQTLCDLSANVTELDTLRAFARDRLAYRQERVAQALDQPDTLWTDAQGMQTSEQTYQRARTRLHALRLTLARRYGGDAWQRLHALLVAMTAGG